MHRVRFVLMTYSLFAVLGCTESAHPQPETSSPSPTIPASEVEDTSSESDQGSPDFEEMFAAIVKGSLRNASEQEEQASWKVMEELAKFDEGQNRAFLEFLEEKLNDLSPFVRMEAGFNVALIRRDLGIGEKNEDLIPLFVDLLKHEDIWVRKFAMNDMDPVVRGSNLGDKLQPLVPVLVAALEEPFTTYQAIAYLGDMGPMSKEAIPAIRKAVERDDDTVTKEAAMEAIQKIEAGAG